MDDSDLMGFRLAPLNSERNQTATKLDFSVGGFAVPRPAELRPSQASGQPQVRGLTGQALTLALTSAEEPPLDTDHDRHDTDPQGAPRERNSLTLSRRAPASKVAPSGGGSSSSLVPSRQGPRPGGGATHLPPGGAATYLRPTHLTHSDGPAHIRPGGRQTHLSHGEGLAHLPSRSLEDVEDLISGSDLTTDFLLQNLRKRHRTKVRVMNAGSIARREAVTFQSGNFSLRAVHHHCQMGGAENKICPESQ